jgi:hypothetical protein
MLEAQIERLWSYRNHVDKEFFVRLNFFLVFESVLLAVASQLSMAPAMPVGPIKLFEVAGIVITLIWAYAQIRSKYVLDWLAFLCKENIPEYTIFRRRGRWQISSMWLLTYAIPAVVTGIWINFLFV